MSSAGGGLRPSPVVAISMDLDSVLMPKPRLLLLGAKRTVALDLHVPPSLRQSSRDHSKSSSNRRGCREGVHPGPPQPPAALHRARVFPTAVFLELLGGGGEGGTCHLFSFFSVIFGGHYLVFQGLQLVLQLDDVCGGVSPWAQRSHSPPQLHPQKAFPVPKSFIVLGKVGGRVLAKWGPYPWRWGGSAWCLPPERFLERRRLYFILFFIFPQKRAFFLHKTSAPAVVPGRVGDPRGWGPPGQELRGPWTRGPRPPGRNWGTPKRGAPPALPGPPRGTQPAPTEPHRCVSPWLGWWSGGGGGSRGFSQIFWGVIWGWGPGGAEIWQVMWAGVQAAPPPPPWE